jgi:hypothetical protein
MQQGELQMFKKTSLNVLAIAIVGLAGCSYRVYQGS